MRRTTKKDGLALVVDLDCFLQVGVATSLWSFVEMIQPEPGARVGHVTCRAKEGDTSEVVTSRGIVFRKKMTTWCDLTAS